MKSRTTIERKFLPFVLTVFLMIGLPVVYAAGVTGYNQTVLPAGDQNGTVTITERYSDGTVKTITETFSINNNAADIYTVGTYRVFVDTKGNDQIRECRIMEEMPKAA